MTPSYDIVHYGSIDKGYRQLCSGCFNLEAAQLAGLKGFEHAKFHPVGLTDCAGVLHEFHFRLRLFGPGVALDTAGSVGSPSVTAALLTRSLTTGRLELLPVGLMTLGMPLP